MDTPQSKTETATNALARMPQHTKILAVMAAMVIVAIALAVNWPAKPVSCELIQGCALRNADLQRMQIALNTAGLNDFEIKEHTIYVPKSERDVYLKAITEAEVLPADLCLAKDDTAVNPLLSRDQREQIQFKEKKNLIREMVMRLAFVEQAWFEMDLSKAKSAFHQEQHSAVILIQPTGKHLLDSEQIETIRGLIAGSIAGMDRNTIVVTDLNAGFAYQGNERISSQPDAPQATVASNTTLASAEIRDKKNRYENKIRQSLADLEGVSIQVEITRHPVKAQIAAPSKTLTPSRPRAMTVGTNSQAIVSTATSNAAPPSEAVVATEDRIKVNVTVPEALVLSKLNAGKRDTISSLRQEPAYRSQFDAIKSDVTRRIRPILPAAAFTSSGSFPIVFDISPETNEAALAGSQGVWPTFIKRMGGPWAFVAIVAASLLILMFVFSGANKQPETIPMPSPAIVHEPEPAVAAATSQDQDIRQEISQLIKEDPEAAAQVIKRWIRNAA